MLTRRDLVALLWYCVIFSAVVAWAVLRGGGETAATSRTDLTIAAEPGSPDQGEPHPTLPIPARIGN